MSGASDIPADILATASKYAHDLREWAAHGNTMTVYHDNDEHAFADTIARAIMAERERCAKIADVAAQPVPMEAPSGLARTVYDGLDRAAMQRAQMIATAIRRATP